MRTIEREIVGGFIFSKDQKVLLGKNRKGGVKLPFLATLVLNF